MSIFNGNLQGTIYKECYDKEKETTAKRCMRPGCMGEVKETPKRRRTSPSYTKFCKSCNDWSYKQAKVFHMSTETSKLLLMFSRKKFNRED